MARTLRASVGGICCHVINRGNGGAAVFLDEADYRAFIDLMTAAHRRLAMRLLGYCLMPNHFHLVLWPIANGDLSRWMQWLTTSHVRRHHRRHDTGGHIWQGRFKSFPIQSDHHLLAVLRYVERNPLRAGLVDRAEGWPWSSLSTAGQSPACQHPWPVPRPADWHRHVNQPDGTIELASLRRSVNRGTPWGEPNWVDRTANRLGLESTLRPRGRPRLGADRRDPGQGQ